MQELLTKVTKDIEIEWNYDGVVALVSDNNYDFLTALYEIIDNAFAAGATSVTIEVFTDSENNVTNIVAIDNGTGLKQENIGKAFSPGALKGDSINEHGAGLKASIRHFGELNFFESKLGSEGSWILTNLNPDENDGKLSISINPQETEDTGVELEINCTKTPYNMNCHSNVPSYQARRLGRRYADILSEDGVRLTVSYMGISDDGEPFTKKESEVRPHYPEYSQHLLVNHPIVGKNNSFEAYLDVYKLGEMSEYSQGDPVKPTTGSAGLDIVMHGRVVVERTKSPLAKVSSEVGGEFFNFSHPSQNRLYGRLRVEHGIRTTPKKNNIQEATAEFQELQEIIASIWEEKDLKSYFKTESEESNDTLSEKEIEDNLIDYIEDDYEFIGRQLPTVFGMRLDVLAKRKSDDEKVVFEIKADKGTPNSVLQLIGYLHSKGLTHGVLVCDGYSDQTMQFIDSWGDYEIEIWDMSKMKYKALKVVGA